jgi:hypothetical protein
VARWPIAALAAAVILTTAACAGTSGTEGTVGTASTDNSSAATVPFNAFLASVSSATYQDYAGQPGVQVHNPSQFQPMRAYILSRYQGIQVTRSFTDADGAVFDCVQQPSAATGPSGLCPTGTIPMRRITLSDLVRFPTLQQFLGKAPGGGQLPPAPNPSD